MPMYKCKIQGLGVWSKGESQPIAPSVIFLQDNDSTATNEAAKLSSAIKVAHRIDLYEFNGDIETRTVLKRECQPGECW